MHRLALALLLSSCATYPPVVVRAAQDFSCPEDRIDTRDLGEGGYRAEGCGRMAVYDCQPAGDGRTICVKQ
jgi:hypothetical protein